VGSQTMSQQFAEKIGDLLTQEGLLTAEQLAKSIAIQKQQGSTEPIGKICVSLGFVAPTDLEKVLIKHRRRIPLGELLVHLGLLTPGQVHSALEQQKKLNPHKKLGAVLIEKGYIDEAGLIRALYEQSQAGNCERLKQGKYDALVATRRLSQRDLDLALRESQIQQRPVEILLMERYKLKKQELGAALSVFYGCPFKEYDEKQPPAWDSIRGLNLNYLKAASWIPLKVSERSVEVLIDDPTAYEKIQDIKRLFLGKQIKFAVGMRDDILRYFSTAKANLEKPQSHESITTILGQLDVAAHDEADDDSLNDPAINENHSAIVRLVNQIITDACRKRVSDIHIEPYGSQNDTEVRFRIDGHCSNYLRVPAVYRRALVSRLKIMAGLDIAERRKPQDGKIKFRLPDREIELRVATIPTAGIGNEDIVLRVLAAGEPIPINELRMTPRNLHDFRELLAKPYGFILCVGPTGSGKTTTLHSALNVINTAERKIWTAEDPVEITQRGLRQVQVNSKIGFNFAAAMRSFLRADPDVIMVGEIRDRETAEIGIEASLTGHLVLSTLHTNSAVETITRLLEMGMDPFNFADALLGVLAQRLARTICGSCKEPYHPTKEELEGLAYGYGEAAFAQLEIPQKENLLLYHGKGCAECNQSGYRGRIGLHELLVVSDEIKRLIHARATVAELWQVAVTQGMTTLVQDGVQKVLAGWTDYGQVKAAATR
ncbi:MAG TPA: ATPase, T2SS/T4P/T4SS family, partial [Candidatus Binatia bacterium]